MIAVALVIRCDLDTLFAQKPYVHADGISRKTLRRGPPGLGLGSPTRVSPPAIRRGVFPACESVSWANSVLRRTRLPQPASLRRLSYSAGLKSRHYPSV
jgi:hypothetical protein